MLTAQDQLLGQRLAGALNARDLEAVAALFDGDVVAYHHVRPGLAPGIESVLACWEELFTAFPNLVVTVDDLFGTGGKVAMRLTLTGTQTGPLRGMAPTGRRIAVSGVGLCRLTGGKIVDIWPMLDWLALLRQLGQLRLSC